jgi:hypothetical protein
VTAEEGRKGKRGLHRTPENKYDSTLLYFLRNCEGSAACGARVFARLTRSVLYFIVFEQRTDKKLRIYF